MMRGSPTRPHGGICFWTFGNYRSFASTKPDLKMTTQSQDANAREAIMVQPRRDTLERIG